MQAERPMESKSPVPGKSFVQIVFILSKNSESQLSFLSLHVP